MRIDLSALVVAGALLSSAPAAWAEEGKPVTLTDNEIKKLQEHLPKDDALREKLEEAKKPHERSMFEKALDLGIWTLVVFLLLLFILGKYAWTPMLEGLAKREITIAAAVEDAKKARDEAALLRNQIAGERQKAQDEIRAMFDQARKNAEQLSEERRAKDVAEIQLERERLQREINIAKEQALKEMWTQSAQLAFLISSKAIGRQLNESDHRSLVDEALGEMNQAYERQLYKLKAGPHA